MKVSTLAFFSVAAAAPAPAPEPQFDALLGGLGGLLGKSGGASGGTGGLGALLGGSGGTGGLGSLLGGLGGAGGAGGLANLIPPGLDLGSIASSFLGGAKGGSGAAPGGFNLSSLTGLASSFLGSSGSTGDASVIIAGYNAIKDKVVALDAVVTKFDKNTDILKERANVEKLSKDLIAALESSTKKIEGMAGPVDVMSVVGLAGPGGEVTEATKLTIAHLVEKKDVFKGDAKKFELDYLKALLAATEKFNTAVNAKLPALVQGIASPQAQQSVDALQQGVTAFS